MRMRTWFYLRVVGAIKMAAQFREFGMCRLRSVLGLALVAEVCVVVLQAVAQLVTDFKPPAQQCCLPGIATRLSNALQDWNQLSRYYDANHELLQQAADPKRVVFMGDSITDLWDIAESFPGKPYVNRGIGGQTTPQMLVRMYPDVIVLKPAAVVILAGTNDIARNTGPETLEQVEDNFRAMC